MKTLTPDVIFVAPLHRVITAPTCQVDSPSEYHAIADNALDISPLDVDQYFITLQRLDIWQDPEALHPGYATLELTLELGRLASPAKPRIEDWVSDNLPGWHIVDWAMAEPDDEFEPMPF
ncbi:hypothetical protein SPB21_07745 [Leptothoe sp. ISB3NOV94-8A]